MVRVLHIDNGVVVNITVAHELAEGDIAAPEGAGIGDLYADGVCTRPTPALPTPEEIATTITRRVQERLDKFAQSRRYDNIKSACTFVGCTVAKFNDEGTYCRDKMAETWAVLDDIEETVKAGNWPTTGAGSMPMSYEEIEPLLPALAWP